MQAATHQVEAAQPPAVATTPSAPLRDNVTDIQTHRHDPVGRDPVVLPASAAPGLPSTEASSAPTSAETSPEATFPASTPVARDELNWSSLAFELKLDGIARQFAINSIVKSWHNQQLQLVYLAELEVMQKPEIEAQIKQAIEQQLGVSLTLKLTSQHKLEVETPHQARLREQEQARQQAIQSIREDALVQQLQAAFGAELLEDSVKKK